MSDFARATQAPRDFTLDGKRYLVGKLTPRGLGDLQAYLKDAIEDPRIVARKQMEGLPDAVQVEIWRQACEAAKDWPPSIGDERSISQLLSAEGQARFLWVLFRRHNDGFTLERAREISDRYELGMEEFNRLMELAGPNEVGDPLPQTGTARA